MITKIDLEDLPGRATRYNNMVVQDIKDFMDSDWTVAEVATDKYKSVHSAVFSYRKAAQRLGGGCEVTERSGRCFLIKK